MHDARRFGLDLYLIFRPPSMDASTYPGKGLSPSQLIFALNEELRGRALSPSYVERESNSGERHADHLRRFTLDTVSQLERDVLTALAAVREWKNSFVPINRIPLDILFLIPTHLSSHKDRFRASFVCRHWRRTFLQYGALWSQLFLTKGKDYVTTFLERAKGSALEVITDHEVPLGTTTLLLPHVQKIRRLDFQSDYFTNIATFSEASSGPLPLLRTLWICLRGSRNRFDQPGILTAPLFCGAINLEEFVLDSKQPELLKHLVFPNLTIFKLSAFGADGLDASYLFDFLKASPTLRTVQLCVGGGITLGNTPRDVVVVLQNVETFSLFVQNNEYQVYEPAARISCPRAKRTSLMQEICDIDMTTGLEIFPYSIPWKEIACQYGSSPVKEVTLKINHVEYSLTSRTSDATVITLGCKVIDTGVEETDFALSWEEMHLEMFSQACGAIRGHPLLPHVKRLHIEDMTGAWGDESLIPAVMVVGYLLMVLGPLDELTIDGLDLRTFLVPFVDLPKFRRFQRVFPPVRELTVSGVWPDDRQWWMNGIVELAKSQHELGIPFERMIIRMEEVPAELTERLGEWVSAVDCYEV